MKSHSLDDGWSPCLETMGDVGPGRIVKGDVGNHLASTFERLSFLQSVHTPPENADARRSQHLV